MGNRTIQDLQMMQAAPLNAKIAMTKRRIRDWVNEFGVDGVYVSFSGGKDSTVLLTIAREVFPSIKGVFCDTGLEFPEIRSFVKTWDNIDWIRPKMNFRQVIEKYGYPFISKEVAECVWGARKYLTSVIESTASLNERTNERTNGISGTSRSIVSYADQMSIAKNSREGGGQQVQETQRNRRIPFTFEWEKLSGTGRYGKQFSPAKLGGGGPARDFANLTGIRTTQSHTTDPRLWSGYRQFADSTPDGNKQHERDKSSADDGEYP